MNPTLRPVQTEDDEFLLNLYISTRMEEVAGFGWPPAQQAAFLRMQFMAQKKSYDAAYVGVEHQIIVINSQPAGRIMVFRTDSQIHLVDISLLPEFRGIGIGSVLIKGLLSEGLASGRSVTLQVEKTNIGAHRLYDRLGFVLTSEDEMYCAMRSSQAQVGEGTAKE